MKISLQWLSDFVTFRERDPRAIADRLTRCVAEVEDVEVQGALLEGCCVGEVVHLRRHPQADRLSLCDVRTDRGLKPVVCGGTNLCEGMKVAFAHVGARVRWHGEDLQELGPAVIRGERSEGMICAAEELDLTDCFPSLPEDGERPIIDLGDALEVGMPLREALGLTDTVFHIDNHAITHRSDLFSHLGFARECCALGLAAWKRRAPWEPPRFPKTPPVFAVRNAAPKLVPRYLGCVLEIEDLGRTPDWMRARLEATGWRSVSLPVDITNYVTMELGMPLHSFDAADFRGDIVLRTSKQGESIVTLDEVERPLPEGAIVISDDAGIFDLLGIMGGLRSSTKATTRRIFLHSAALDPIAIRRAVLATGHRTDAATVYEKGVAPITARLGFLRALELFLTLVPGAHVASKLLEWGRDGTAAPIALSLERLGRILGMPVPAAKARKVLLGLDCAVHGSTKTLTVRPPLVRRDLRAEHDLVEEVGRILGYDAVPTSMPTAAVTLPERDTRIRTLRRALRTRGYTEHLPLSLVGPELLRRARMDPLHAVTLANPLGEELSLLQPSVLPRLLEHAGANMTLVHGTLRTFHVGTVFADGGDRCMELGMLSATTVKPTIVGTPMLRLKRDLAGALACVGYALTVERIPTAPASAHPGRCASLQVFGREIGALFEVHPAVCLDFDLPERTAVAHLDLTALLALAPATTIAREIPRFPAVSYDLTVRLSAAEQLQDLLARARAASALLEHLEVQDLYDGSPLPRGAYAVTLRCRYRSPERTLTESEAQAEHAKVMAVFPQT